MPVHFLLLGYFYDIAEISAHANLFLSISIAVSIDLYVIINKKLLNLTKTL